MIKKLLLKALRGNVKVYCYTKWNDDCGGYIQIVKSYFIETVKQCDDDMNFDNVEVHSDSIYIG